MTRTLQRTLLLVLAATGAYAGPWATIAPRSFYDSFPGFGRVWVGVDGAYNEHLIRDVGATYTALLVLSLLAALSLQPTVVMVAGATWLTFGTLHASYHLPHLGEYGALDQVLNAIALGGSVVMAALLVLPRRDRAGA
ncbi:hypothetical protein [Aeromicrobium sp. NPDC092404]|uniref:hypothetical protein n=1 Tax=Aeromicrobium sp. NPDC092404 TaxID=3154976 RepID=UPI00341273EA